MDGGSGKSGKALQRSSARCVHHVGLDFPAQPEAEALRLRQESPSATPPRADSASFKLRGFQDRGRDAWEMESERRGDPEASGNRSPKLACLPRRLRSVLDGNVNRWRDAVLPPEVSDRNQSRGRGESGLGDPGDRPFLSCKYPVPAMFPPELGGSRGKGELGSASRGHSHSPLWREACGFHSYQRASVSGGTRAWPGEAGRPAVGGFRGLPGAEWPGRGETAGVVPAPGPRLSPAAEPGRPLPAGVAVALASEVLAVTASERVPRAALRGATPTPPPPSRASVPRLPTSLCPSVSPGAGFAGRGGCS